NFPGYIHEGHVNNWGVFNLSGKNISNLKGIEYFTNLSSLNISNNNLTSVDLSHNTNLEDLYCSNNQLTSLNLSNLTNLEILDCSNNKLTTLYAYSFSELKTINCSYNTLLTYVYCYNDNLTSLNVTGCTALKQLKGDENPNLSTVTGLADCTAMTYINLGDCALTDISAVSGMPNLTTLEVYNNRLTSLDVHGKSNLKTLNIFNNPLLTDLKCYSCNLTYLNVSACTALQGLRCYYNADLTSIMGLADCTAITYLDCEDCQISELPVNAMNNLTALYARNNKLTSLAVNNKGSLVTLRVSGNTTLTTLSCYRNALTSLNITGCTGLKDLRCYENANLTTITGLADCTAITYLDCEDCKISDLSAVNTMTNIQKIYARNNKLTTFAVTGKSDLTYLRVSGNQSLTTLQCANNALTTLDFTNCPALTHASCAGNSLTSLTVTGCTSLKNLFCNRNRISGTAMTNLVNSLPTRTASDPGNFHVLNNTNENNVITAEQLAIARGKYWNPKKWNGSDWVDLTVSTRGDVNGDGSVDISDATTLINYLLYGDSTGVDLAAANVNNDTGVDISDATTLINYLLYGSW
ncbi:MAG: leucine-rich repeat domain-containing protein, partial [Muribaculaceae bacterium]|nr:leucine-rich repeat domain-containing protein [Muribaculaceae bacterium]